MASALYCWIIFDNDIKSDDEMDWSRHTQMSNEKIHKVHRKCLKILFYAWLDVFAINTHYVRFASSSLKCFDDSSQRYKDTRNCINELKHGDFKYNFIVLFGVIYKIIRQAKGISSFLF